MRIIKLSPKMGFHGEDDVKQLLEDDLPNAYQGRFRMSGHPIRAGSPEVREVILFACLGQVYYIARAASERQVNRDEYEDTLPYYFEVDLDSIHPVELSLADLEERYEAATGEFKHLNRAQGWPELTDKEFESALWRKMMAKLA